MDNTERHLGLGRKEKTMYAIQQSNHLSSITKHQTFSHDNNGNQSYFRPNQPAPKFSSQKYDSATQQSIKILMDARLKSTYKCYHLLFVHNRRMPAHRKGFHLHKKTLELGVFVPM